MLLTRKKYSVPGVRPRTVTAWLVVRPTSIPVVEPNAGVVPNSTWLVVGTLVVHSILAEDAPTTLVRSEPRMRGGGGSGVAVLVCVAVALGSGVRVGARVMVAVAASVAVAIGVGVRVGASVGVRVGVACSVALGVGVSA